MCAPSPVRVKTHCVPPCPPGEVRPDPWVHGMRVAEPQEGEIDGDLLSLALLLLLDQLEKDVVDGAVGVTGVTKGEGSSSEGG